jgi:hypothetical protein
MKMNKERPAGSSFWQIIFPTLVGGILVIAIGVWFALNAGSSDLSRFAEISTVLLVVPVLITSLVFGLILVGSIYLVVQVIKWVPGVTEWILEKVQLIQRAAVRLSKFTASLVIEPAAFLAGVRRKKTRPDQKIDLIE